MFFILSKTLSYLTQPLVVVCIIFLLSIFLRKPVWKKRMFWIGLALLFFFSNEFIANEAMLAWEVKPVPFSYLKKRYKYGIVLTGITIGKRNPSDRVYFDKGVDRVYHTVQLYKLGHIEKILVSGGNGRLVEVEEKEANELKKTLLVMGVPEKDIVLENNSRNTHESALAIKEMFADTLKASDCILITSAFHMRRSLACFKKVGLGMDVFSTDLYTHPRSYDIDVLIVPKVGALHLWSKLSKEWTGFLAYKLAGYV
jgi:uncharacterized SAM-binding protein YcdF (DUF218 family)